MSIPRPTDPRPTDPRPTDPRPTDPGLARWDATVEQLRAGLPTWQAVPLGERIRLLHDLRRRVGAESPGMVAAMRAAQGLGPGGPWAVEGWGMVLPMAAVPRALERVLSRIAAGRDPLPAGAVHRRDDGRLAVDVFPLAWDDRLLMGDYRAQVWLAPGRSEADVRREAAVAHRGGGFADPGVALLLGAGNAALLTLSDVLHLLYAEGCTVAVKLNPVLAYLRPALERVLAGFVAGGWVRFVDEAPEVGAYLAAHPGVDRVHMTGSAATFDALVWGTGDAARARRAAGTPLLVKPFSAELGGVAPMVVVPGDWTSADLRRQADVIAAAKLCNAGHICASPQVLVLPDGWPQADRLLDELRAVMREVEPRTPYYPGHAATVDRAVAGRPDVETLLAPHHRLLVTGLDPADDASLLQEEVFADVLGIVRLPAPDVEGYLENAVRFADERLAGTLSATLLIDPDTARRHAAALDRAVADLHYGSVGVNVWPIISFFLGTPSWGAYPGHTAAAIGSGTGTVLNPFGLPEPEKSVVTGTFRPKVRPFTSLRNRTALTTARRLLRYWTTDDVLALPGVLGSALRG